MQNNNLSRNESVAKLWDTIDLAEILITSGIKRLSLEETSQTDFLITGQLLVPG
jgi:hypothetical protein